MIVTRDAVSDRFRRAIRRSHTVASLAQVLDAQEVVLREIGVSAGGVSIDANAEIRASCTVTLHDEDLIPVTAQDLFAPYGNRLKLARGVEYRSGNTELVSLGIFRINDSNIEDNGDSLSITVTGQDKSVVVSDDKFEESYQIQKETEAGQAIKDIIERTFPGISFNFDETNVPLPALFAEEGSDPWDLALGIAQAIGGEVYFDSEGVPTLRPVATPVDEPITEINEGEDGVLIGIGKQMTRQNSFNKVIVTADNSGGIPARGEAADLDPESPTYYYGPFGRAPRFESNEFVTTDEQCADMAEGILAKEIGATQQINFNSVPDPVLTVGDVAKIVRVRIGVNESHVIDSLDIGLGSEETMSGVTRSVTVSTEPASSEPPGATFSEDITTGDLEDGEYEFMSLVLPADDITFDRVITSVPARVRVYESEAQAIADADRGLFEDPVGDHGCSVDVVTAVIDLDMALSPEADTTTDEAGDEFFVTVTNLAGYTTDVLVTLAGETT